MARKSKTIDSYNEFLKRYMPSYYARQPAPAVGEPGVDEQDQGPAVVQAMSRFIITGRKEGVLVTAARARRRGGRAKAKGA